MSLSPLHFLSCGDPGACALLCAVCVRPRAFTLMCLPPRVHFSSRVPVNVAVVCVGLCCVILCSGYRDEWCFWESVVICRKFLIAAVAGTLAGSQHGHQAFVAIFIVVGCLMAQLTARPYTDATEGHLETASLVASSTSLFLGLLFILGGLSRTGELAAVATLAVLNVGYICWVVAVLVARVCTQAVALKPVLSHHARPLQRMRRGHDRRGGDRSRGVGGSRRQHEKKDNNKKRGRQGRSMEEGVEMNARSGRGSSKAAPVEVVNPLNDM